MKIEQIDLKAYGHFTNRRLSLAGDRPISTSFAAQTKPARQRSGEQSMAHCSESRNARRTRFCMTPRNCVLALP